MVRCRAGDRIGDRVHQERHVVVDDRQAHAAAARLAAGRFEADGQLAAAALSRDFGDERAASPWSCGLNPSSSSASALADDTSCKPSIVAAFGRVSTVMSRHCSACLAMRGGLVP